MDPSEVQFDRELARLAQQIDQDRFRVYQTWQDMKDQGEIS